MPPKWRAKIISSPATWKPPAASSACSCPIRKSPFPQQLSFAHVFLPEMAVGGDYYDLKQLDDRRVALLMADVSGHGMSAAFITGLIKTTFEFG